MDTAKTDLSDWMMAIQHAERYRRKYGRQETWGRIEGYYANEFDAPKDTVLPTFNLVYMHGRALLPSVIFRAPAVTNVARRPEFIPFASLMDRLDSFLVDEVELKEAAKEAVLHAYLCGVGALTCGFDEITTKLSDSAESNPLREIILSRSGFAKIPGVVDRARRQNFPWVSQLHPERVLFPEGTENLRKARWVAYVHSKRLADLKLILGKGDIQPTHRVDPTGTSKSLGPLETGIDYVQYYEIHDASTGKVMLLSSEDEVLQDWTKDESQVDGLPVEIITFNKHPRAIWGTPDALYIEGQMLDGNDCRKMGLKQRRVALVKALVNEELITKEEAEKFFSDDALPLIRVKNLGNKPLSEAIATVQPHVQLEYMQYQKTLMEDSQYILGFGHNQMGNFSPGRRTKYEAQVVADTNFVRTSERMELVAEAIGGIMRKVNHLVLKKWKGPILSRVLGADGALYLISARPEELNQHFLRDELATHVEVESLAPVSKDRVKGEMLEVLQAIGKVQGVNIIPIVQQLLSKFAWADVEKLLPQASQAAPMDANAFAQQQQQMAQQPKAQQSLKDVISAAGPMLMKGMK